MSNYGLGYIRAIMDHGSDQLHVAKYIGRDEGWSLIRDPRISVVRPGRVFPFNLNLIMFLLTMTAAQDPTGIRDKL